MRTAQIAARIPKEIYDSISNKAEAEKKSFTDVLVRVLEIGEAVENDYGVDIIIAKKEAEILFWRKLKGEYVLKERRKHNFSILDFYIEKKLQDNLEREVSYDEIMKGYLCNIQDNHLDVTGGLNYVKKKIKGYLNKHNLRPEWKHRLDFENI